MVQPNYNLHFSYSFSVLTRKPSCRWQTRASRKHAKNCSNSTVQSRFVETRFAETLTLTLT